MILQTIFDIIDKEFAVLQPVILAFATADAIEILGGKIYHYHDIDKIGIHMCYNGYNRYYIDISDPDLIVKLKTALAAQIASKPIARHDVSYVSNYGG